MSFLNGLHLADDRSLHTLRPFARLACLGPLVLRGRF